MLFIFALFAVLKATALEDQKQLMEDWDKHMRGFIPDDMIQFKLAKNSEEILIEKILEPTTIRGTFFIPLNTNDTIDFKIIDPSGVMIYTKVHKKEAVFSVNVTQKGDYQICFVNRKDEKFVTFAIDVKNSQREEITSEDIDPLENNVEMVNNKIRDIYYGHKLSQIRTDGAFGQMTNANSKLMWLTIVETIAICGVTLWQVHFIKKMLNDRRLV